MIIQTIHKLYPSTYTGNSFEKLKELLENGWIVKHITLSKEDKEGAKVYDYILEKDTSNY